MNRQRMKLDASKQLYQGEAVSIDPGQTCVDVADPVRTDRAIRFDESTRQVTGRSTDFPAKFVNLDIYQVINRPSLDQD